jgi:membrane protein implicated in regulation of membrane protease activity
LFCTLESVFESESYFKIISKDLLFIALIITALAFIFFVGAAYFFVGGLASLGLRSFWF